MEKHKYNTEERKEAKRRWNRKYYEKHREQQREYSRNHYQANKAAIAEHKRVYREANREKRLEQMREWYEANRDARREYNKTPMGRAINLVNAYKHNDTKYNRGECTLTAKWIVDNIFNSTCHYCGESDWKLLGCDRIDNSLPHTPENVVPCCYACNCKRQKKDYNTFKAEMGVC